MTEIRELDYRCPEHGTFNAAVDVLTADFWEHDCPRCGRRCGRPPVDAGGIAPALVGCDSHMFPYFSRIQRRWVRSPADVRNHFAATDTVPLTDADIRGAEETIAQQDYEARRERERLGPPAPDTFIDDRQLAQLQDAGT